MNDEITRMNTGFENQTTLDALIGTGVTNGSAYATLAASILSDVNDVTAADASFCLAAYGAVPGTGEEPETYPTTTRLGAAQAQNQQDYDAELAAIAAEYREELRVAENDWRLAALDAYADEETSLTTALLARKSSLANDYGTYLTALSVAATQYSERVTLNDQVYSYNQERIDHFNATVALSGIFTNPTFDYEVCFVAGTPVLMPDGSRRAIETLRPGDLVLAADHLNPESAPAPAKVVRFFDNGEKTVVRLRFEGQELVCTPEHPFYVVGKGWIRADELVEGDLCLNAKGESVAFISREELAEKQRVYNIEVKGAHTYFVGDDDGVLAHNFCHKCGDSGFIWVGTEYYPKRAKCPLCASLKDYSEPKEGIKESNVKRLMEEYCLSRQQVMDLLSAMTLAEYMKAFYNASDEQFEEFKRATTEESNKSHYEERFNRNKMHEFVELDWDQLSNPRWKAQVEKGGVVTCEFLGSRWRLLENWRSREHKRANERVIDIDGFDENTPVCAYGFTYMYECYKWCSDDGRELVIQAKYEVKYVNGRLSKRRVATFLEIDPDKYGTYNNDDPYFLLGVPHLFEDYVPYKKLGNVPHINK